MLNTELWIAIIGATALLYVIKWFLDKKRKVKVYRISPKSLQRSKDVMMAVLPLVEDGGKYPLDSARLPYPRKDIKSAAKILIYYFWREKQYEELERIKGCYVAISRFQDQMSDTDSQERRAIRDKKILQRELDLYLTHEPFVVGKEKQKARRRVK